MPGKTASSSQRPRRRYGFGWLPDLPDHRDFLYAAIAKPPKKLPPSVDLRSDCSPVENQGNIGSCTANALVGALEYLEKKNDLRSVNLSRLFVYYNERKMINMENEDSGAYLRDGIKTLVKQGVCGESLWEYKYDNLFTKPPKKCYDQGQDHQIISYHRITTLQQMRECLAEGFPFAFGFSVYSEFLSDKVKKTGVVNLPGPDESLEGGHAVLAVGYNDKDNRFLVRNSWGKAWGMKGYFTMPYGYMVPNLSDDFWTIRRSEHF